MYIPKHFEVTDQNGIYEFIEGNSFGQLNSTVDGRLFSSHIPFLLSADCSKIICHIAKQNPQHKGIEGQEALVVLQGEHDYISPSWYEHEGAPTWNYQAVHIYGKCTIINEQEKLKSIVETLAEKYESQSSDPWKPQYPEAMLSSIISIEINITEIQCKYKLSQNRPAVDRENVVEKLKLKGAFVLAGAMEKHAL
jgi:transcriptional regulator